MTTTSETKAVCIADYLDRPYDEVCGLLERFSGRPFSDESAVPSLLVGDLVRVGRRLGRLSVRRAGATENIAELRIIAVRTGREAVTELLLVAPAMSWMSREDRVRDAQTMLEAVVRQIDETSMLQSKAPPLAS